MKYLLSVIFAFAFVDAHALQLPDIFGDNMMLQQQTQAKMWGWGEKGNTITIAPSWTNQTYTVQVPDNGRWDITVPTPKASYDTYTVTVRELTPGKKGKEVASRVINNVLIGEVWFCSGQSNMEITLNGFWNCPIEGSNEAIAQSGKYKKSIRVAFVEHHGTQAPQDSVKARWDVCEPQDAGGFTACGYFFATTLTDILDVPVGIINCSWGGSCVEGWMPKDILLTYPDGLTPIDDTEYHSKMIMYNGMLHPLAGYTIKGFLWNQGESNVGREKEYIDRFATMTRLWRKMWNQPSDKLPMYAVELPPYRYGDGIDGICGPQFRCAQHAIAKVLDNYGCVCTSDLIYDYEKDQIHACKKQEIGQRLAYLAATRDYGVKGISAEAPEFEYMTISDANDEDKTVIAGSVVEMPKVTGQVASLYFYNSQDGFDRMTDLEGFEVKDSKGVWHPAIAWTTSAWHNEARRGPFLKVCCPDADQIKNVRYCYKNFIKGKLHSTRGLPVVPFTTEK